MDAKENERIGCEALDTFVRILLERAAAAGDDAPIDARIVVEEYFLSQTTGHPPEAISARLRELADAVRGLVL